jgi:polar amino acid transport system substrate-binding protein
MKYGILVLATLILTGHALLAQPLTIYTEIDAPLQVEGPDGHLTGLSVEVVQEIQKRTGNTDPITVVPWARGYLELQTLPNVVLFCTARTVQRDALFKWVGPIDEKVYSLFIKGDSKTVIKTIEDAKKLGAIGVYKDDVRDLYLTKAGFTNLQRTVDNVANVKKLMAGRIDAFASDPISAQDLAKSAGYRAEDLREAFPFLTVQLNIAFSKTTPDVTVEAWTAAWIAMKKDKTYEHLFRKYYPSKPMPGKVIIAF